MPALILIGLMLASSLAGAARAGCGYSKAEWDALREELDSRLGDREASQRQMELFSTPLAGVLRRLVVLAYAKTAPLMVLVDLVALNVFDALGLYFAARLSVLVVAGLLTGLAPVQRFSARLSAGRMPASDLTAAEFVANIVGWLLATAAAYTGLLPSYGLSAKLPWVFTHLAEVPYDVCFVLALISYLLLLVSSLVMRGAGRVAKLFSSPTFEAAADKSTTLYLRSFRDDRLSIWAPVTGCALRSSLWPCVPFEEFLSYVIGGDLVAIGSERERLPRPGAQRTYFRGDDVEWRRAAELTARRCGRVVVTVGTTGALGWEVGMLRRTGMASKAVFVVPPVDSGETKARIRALFDFLGVGEGPRAQLESLPMESVVSLCVRRDGSVEWQLAPNRSWFSYFVALKSTEPGLTAPETGGPGALPPRPLKGSRGARRALRATNWARSRMLIGEYGEAAQGYLSALEGGKWAGDAGARAMLGYRLLECLHGCGEWSEVAGRTDAYLDELEASGESWVWLSAGRQLTAHEVERDVRMWQMRALCHLRDRAGALRAARLALGAARSCPDRLELCRCLCAVAWLTDSASEVRGAASEAHELANALADERLRATSAKYLARALRAANGGDERWQGLYEEAVEALLGLGDQAMAADVLDEESAALMRSGREADLRASAQCLERAARLRASVTAEEGGRSE